jgi:hypothetical protein
MINMLAKYTKGRPFLCIFYCGTLQNTRNHLTEGIPEVMSKIWKNLAEHDPHFDNKKTFRQAILNFFLYQP